MQRTSFLDSVWARLIAALVALVASGVLAYLNRDMLFGEPDVGDVSVCLEERLGEIEALVANGTVETGQVAELQIRARQLCQHAE